MKKTYLTLTAALLSLTSFGQVDRVTLIETFTSATCPPCVGGNINLENLLADSQNDDKQVSLKYQVDWPGNGDPYYTEEVGVRTGIYAIGGVPASRLDGTTEYNTGSLTQSNLNTAYAEAAKARIEAFYVVDEVNKTVDVQVEVEVLENTPPGVRLFIAVFENATNNNVASNGETEFYHVMKKMLPGSNGVVMPPMTAGEIYNSDETYTFQGNYTLPANALDPVDHAVEHSIEEFSDLGVAVWVQTISTREVYQAGYAKVSAAGIAEEAGVIATAKIYPNPASDIATIAFQTVETQDFSIDVYNALGQVIYTTEMKNMEAGRITHNIDTESFENGLYTVRISSEKGSLSKRLSVQN